MANASTKSQLTVKLHQGDAKTLIACDLPKSATRNLAGFTIQCEPDGKPPYYIFNELQFQDLAEHAQDPKELPRIWLSAAGQRAPGSGSLFLRETNSQRAQLIGLSGFGR